MPEFLGSSDPFLYFVSARALINAGASQDNRNGDDFVGALALAVHFFPRFVLAKSSGDVSDENSSPGTKSFGRYTDPRAFL